MNSYIVENIENPW